MQHGIIADHLVDLQRGDAAAPGDFGNQLRRNGADFVLCVDQHRHDRRSLLGSRVAGQHLGEFIFESGRKRHYRSVSPSTKSTLPSAAMESAISTSFKSTPRAWTFPKLGV